jgi:hypothetical protein
MMRISTSETVQPDSQNWLATRQLNLYIMEVFIFLPMITSVVRGDRIND